VADRWWPGVATATASTLAHAAIFGFALLVGSILLWWAAFRAFWHWWRSARWHAVARGSDVPQTVAWGAALVFFGLVGSLPLIVAIFIYAQPEVLTFDALSRVLAAILSLLFLLLTFFWAVLGPVWDAQARKTTSGKRLVTCLSAPIVSLMLLNLAGRLWPATRPPAELDLLFSIVTAIIALGWQFYAVCVHRQILGSWMTCLVVLLPLAGAVASSGGRGDWGVRIYAAITGALIGGAFLWHHRRELPQIARDIRSQF
jgi:hypothetical protein